MANLAPIRVTHEAQDITRSLTADQAYYVQNVSGQQVWYAISATNPSNANIGWNVLNAYQTMQVTPTAGTGLWVRTEAEMVTASLTISDAA